MKYDKKAQMMLFRDTIIDALSNRGMTVKSVFDELTESNNISMSYTQFAYYVRTTIKPKNTMQPQKISTNNDDHNSDINNTQNRNTSVSNYKPAPKFEHNSEPDLDKLKKFV